MNRRQALKTTALAGVAIATTPSLIAQTENPPRQKPILISTAASEPFVLPLLPYAFDALEPFIDAQTMQIHHDKHHAAYVTNLNKAWEKMPWSGPPPDFAYLENNWLNNPKFLSENPAIRNNGGGHYNHTLFWQMMKKNGGGTPTGELAKSIDSSFGSFSAFKEAFTKAALGQFGSGWAWLVAFGKSPKLEIMATPNQDTPLLSSRTTFSNDIDASLRGDKKYAPLPVTATPLLGVDVWEHAYYLKYQNKRVDYVNAWLNVVNWDFVSERFIASTK